MKAKVLVVDDSSLARRTTRRIIEELGHDVDEASDGAQALERYFLNKHDVVVLDMVMTGMYGLDVLAQIRQLDPIARVIVATADIQQSTREQARFGGASGFLTKPINRQKLAEVLADVLEGRAAWN